LSQNRCHKTRASSLSLPSSPSQDAVILSLLTTEVFFFSPENEEKTW